MYVLGKAGGCESIHTHLRDSDDDLTELGKLRCVTYIENLHVDDSEKSHRKCPARGLATEVTLRLHALNKPQEKV